MIQHEIAVFNDWVAVEDVDDSIAVISCEINEFHVVEGHIGVNDFDAGAVGEIHLFDVAASSILEAHAEMLRLVKTIKLDSVCVGANH